MFEVLQGLPPYGDLPKLISDTGSPVYREGYVVRFLGGTPQEWVGNFQRGLCSFDYAARHPNGTHVLVIAGGSGYVIDPVTQLVVDSFGGQIESCCATPAGGGLVLSDLVGVRLISRAGLAWRSRRLAWDGLRILQVTNDTIHGEARHYDDSWHPFSVSIADGGASGGAYDGLSPNNSFKPNPLRGSA